MTNVSNLKQSRNVASHRTGWLSGHATHAGPIHWMFVTSPSLAWVRTNKQSPLPCQRIPRPLQLAAALLYYCDGDDLQFWTVPGQLSGMMELWYFSPVLTSVRTYITQSCRQITEADYHLWLDTTDARTKYKCPTSRRWIQLTSQTKFK